MPLSYDDNKPTTVHDEFALGSAQTGRGEEIAQYEPGGAEEKAFIRKLDYRLIPIIWFMYVMSYLDRANIGNAKTGGMERDLNLTSNEYSIALLVFFAMSSAKALPSNMILVRVKPAIYLPALMCTWGGISMCLAACNSYQTLSVVRFFLGIVEAGFAPGILFLLSSWYRKNELATRFALYYTASAFSGALGGLLAGVITGNLDGKGGVAGWRYLFIIEGAATIIASLFAYWLLPNFPATTSWLTEREKWLCAARLQADGVGAAQGDSETLGHGKALKSVLADWRTYFMTFLFMMVTGAQTIQYFIPTLTKKMGYQGVMAQYMTIPIYMVAVVGIIIIPMSSDRTKERAWHITISMLGGAACFAVLIATQHPKVQYAFLCFGVAAIYANPPLVLVWTSNIIAYPAEKRAITQAFVNALGNSASIYGSFLWPAKTGPKYTMGFAVTLAMLAACAAGAQAMNYLNKKYPYSYEMPARRQDVEMPEEMGTGAETPLEKSDMSHAT
ncbi:hypothetical protein NliqN6_5371 [Naganishia liquefaciens]|uniref:Major facilitator superfamily (MFS) profile domain-containing protein n=1 Tax=Naganishia liquefaciens TaxID=104408 RepID=A0A8H3TZD1_9TREE|nr:hypothetical protein NliqN6_5371 [Naganishia liquefaciens]